MNEIELQNVAQTLLQIKQQLLCPICMDIQENTKELKCGHQFCTDCLNNYVKSAPKPICPVCKTEIKRRSVRYKDQLADEMGDFLRNLIKFIKTDYNFEVEKIKYIPKAQAGTSKQNIDFIKTSITDDLEATKQPLSAPKPVGFKDVKTKENVISWLNDNKNVFNRITQTQHKNITDSSSQDSLALPSVSQRVTKTLRNRTTVGLSKKSRTRSLNITVDKINPPAVQRHSTAGVNLNHQESYEIEQYDSEENPIVHLESKVMIDVMEDEFLDQIDSEIKNMPPPLSPKKSAERKHAGKSPNCSIESEWKRLERIDTISRARKQLNITAESSIKVDAEKENKKKYLMVVLGDVRKSCDRKETEVAGDSHQKDCPPLDPAPKKASSPVSDDDEDIYSIPTPIFPENTTAAINKESNNLVMDNIDVDDDDDLLIATQVISYENKRNQYLFNQNSDNPLSIIINLEAQIRDYIPDQLHMSNLLEHTRILKEKLALVPTKSIETQTNTQNSTSVGIQTTQPLQQLIGVQTSPLSQHSFGVQTSQLLCVNKETQTDVEPVKDLRSTMAQTSQSEPLCPNQQIEAEVLNPEMEIGEEISFHIDPTDQPEDNVFSTSLEYIDFETQEALKKHSKMITDKRVLEEGATSQKSLRSRDENKKQFKRIRVLSPDSESLKKRAKMIVDQMVVEEIAASQKSLPSSEIKCTIVNIEDENKQQFKRLRVPSPDSPERPLKRVPSINRLRSNTEFSVQFDSCPGNYSNSESNVNHEQIPTAPPILEPELLQSKRDTQDIRETCEQVIENATKHLHKRHSLKHTADEEIQKEIEEFKEYLNSSIPSEYSDILSGTEQFPPEKHEKLASKTVVDKNSESLFTNSNRDRKFSSVVEDEAHAEVNPGFEDDIDAELERIHMSFEEENQNKINILQNIKLSQDRFREEHNVSGVPLEICESDEDIVETTPQKKRLSLKGSRSMMSQLHEDEDIVEIDSQFLMALPPPPGFQDDAELDENLPLTHQSSEKSPPPAKFLLQSSVTPDKLSPPANILLQSSVTPDKLSPPAKPHSNAQLDLIEKCSSMNKINEILKTSAIFNTSSCSQTKPNLTQSSNVSLVLGTHMRPQSKQNIMTSTPKQKSMWNYVQTPIASQTGCPLTPIAKSKPCIAYSRLSTEQIIAITRLCSKKLASCSSSFGKQVTHMIVDANEANCVVHHTSKFFFAVASGIWVLRFEWIKDCLERNRILPEEPYEVLDIGGVPGPQTSRLTRTRNPLLKGYKFHCAGPFLAATRTEIEHLVTLLGGIVAPTPKDLIEKDDYICMIVSEVKATADYHLYEDWLATYKTITVDLEWLMGSIGQYQLLSVRPYLLCGDNYTISDLGYPESLLVDVPLTLLSN